MKQFNEKGQCPKCGNKVVNTKYCRNYNTDHCWITSHNYLGMGVEHLDRRCAKCGYSWPEEPLKSAAHDLHNVEV